VRSRICDALAPVQGASEEQSLTLILSFPKGEAKRTLNRYAAETHGLGALAACASDQRKSGSLTRGFCAFFAERDAGFLWQMRDRPLFLGRFGGFFYVLPCRRPLFACCH
jgi:hypothetical protein